MGALKLEFDRIPNKALMPVIRKRDIMKARILARKEKERLQPGSPDVLLVSPLGYRQMLSRREFIREYKHINGRRIQLAGWKGGREYFVMKDDNTPAVALFIPRNCNLSVRGKKVTGGSYVVCFRGEQGGIDRNRPYFISRALFRKMFTVLPNEIIERNKGKGAKDFRASRAKTKGRQAEPVARPKVLRNTESRQPVISRNTKEVDNRFEAIGRIVNSQDKIIGFLIRDPNGMSRQVTKREMVALCERELVKNIIVATREADGVKYLRGNGIRIGELRAFRA